MKLIVNGNEVEAKATLLGDLLTELEFEGDWLATAVDSQLVAAEDRETFALTEGARIEILSPMQGG
ncbi:MAG: sulfur carrier protein ThiS [Cohaesibacter sp.]|jgi:sulfur carrier protein|nr:sulfur carrier protein ThiS [Cohaesibacter sp.]